MTEHDRTQLVRYTRPERWPLLDRFPVSTDLHDRILSEVLAEDTPRTQRRMHELRTLARVTVADMLTDLGYREALHRLPFHGGDRVAALGDSLTADRIGWFELLAESMQLTGHGGVTTHNLGLSGDTTADALERFDLLEAFRPTHVFVLLGTNDARRHGRDNTHPMVSPVETRRNLSALAELITDTLGARTFFITPPAADQARISTWFAGAPVTWVAEDLDAVADLVREVAPGAIDIHRALPQHGDDFLDPDGVHLSLAGQRLVATQVAVAVAGSRPSAPVRVISTG